MFVLCEINGLNENVELARADAPSPLLKGLNAPLMRCWRVQLDGEDIAIVAGMAEHYVIFGLNPYVAEETMFVVGWDNMVQTVREHLQRFYDLGLYVRDDFPGIRVRPS
jgi:hypothetical protein